MGGRQHPARADQDPPTQKSLSRGPPVLDEDRGLPGVGGDVREEASFDAELGPLVLSQATGDCGGQDGVGGQTCGRGRGPQAPAQCLVWEPGFPPTAALLRRLYRVTRASASLLLASRPPSLLTRHLQRAAWSPMPSMRNGFILSFSLAPPITCPTASPSTRASAGQAPSPPRSGLPEKLTAA